MTTPRCDRHVDRAAELHCETCSMSICLACAATRHLPTTTHKFLDIDDAVELCREKLAQRAAELSERQVTCLGRIDDTNARIEALRSKIKPF